jgi:hypothetical protein
MGFRVFFGRFSPRKFSARTPAPAQIISGIRPKYIFEFSSKRLPFEENSVILRVSPGGAGKTPNNQPSESEKIMKANQITAATTAELVAFYNTHADKPVKKFADRATAEKRVAALIASLAPSPADACPFCGGTELTSGHGHDDGSITDEHLFTCHDCGKEYDVNTGEEFVAKETDATRAAAIAASWLNPETAAKRAERHGCEVDGQYFPSVRKAFLALGLPLAKHISFRMDLKKYGEQAFGKHSFVSVAFRPAGQEAAEPAAAETAAE